MPQFQVDVEFRYIGSHEVSVVVEAPDEATAKEMALTAANVAAPTIDADESFDYIGVTSASLVHGQD
jgi:uncharacterized protein with GYD domain